jgi:multiple sugar transport system permease protein
VVNIIRSYFHRNPHLVYIMPAVLILGILTFIPTVFLYFLSITNYELGSTSFHIVWLENYIRLFSGADPEFWPSFRISLSFMVIVTAVELVLGFLLALLLEREFKMKFLVFACMIVPIAMTPSITGQLWKLMLNSENGVINYLLGQAFGLKVVWLSESNALMSIILVDIWQNTPFIALIIYAGLKSLPTEPIEAAMMDGATRYQLFRHVVIPLLKPVLLLAVVFRSMDSLKLFDIPFSLTQGGPGSSTEFLSLHVYRLGFAQTGWVGRASATAVVLLMVITVISMLLIRMFRKGAETKS